LRIARSILMTEPERSHALCVGVDVLPPGASRDVLYNVISDGACAVVLSRGCGRDAWIGCQQISCGYYWDPVHRAPEIMAAYFPMARQVINDLLAANGLRAADIDIVVPTGVNRASWSILLQLVGIPGDRLYFGPDSFGHTMLADNFIHLEHLRRTGAAREGDRLLLFTYGFGSSWYALLLEH
jgi:3-oxoacyl-[acyl-carrier-protein] synthase-3